jgi:hypothetical protein
MVIKITVEFLLETMKKKSNKRISLKCSKGKKINQDLNRVKYLSTINV